jgi:chromosomal replication initiator protein
VPGLLEALLQLQSPAELRGQKIDLEDTLDYLARRNRSAPSPRLSQIATATARRFSLSLSELRGPSRRQAVVTARNVAMYLARLMTPKSLGQIGQYFGGRDHSTVMHGCRKTEGLLKSDPTIRQAVQQIQWKWQNR